MILAVRKAALSRPEGQTFFSQVVGITEDDRTVIHLDRSVPRGDILTRQLRLETDEQRRLCTAIGEVVGGRALYANQFANFVSGRTPDFNNELERSRTPQLVPVNSVRPGEVYGAASSFGGGAGAVVESAFMGLEPGGECIGAVVLGNTGVVVTGSAGDFLHLYNGAALVRLV